MNLSKDGSTVHYYTTTAGTASTTSITVTAAAITTYDDITFLDILQDVRDISDSVGDGVTFCGSVETIDY